MVTGEYEKQEESNLPSSVVLNRDDVLCPFLSPWVNFEADALHQPLLFLAIGIAHDDVFAPSSALEVTDETSIVLHLAF